jgi:tetratricopeptide (TPR) repeat protein
MILKSRQKTRMNRGMTKENIFTPENQNLKAPPLTGDDFCDSCFVLDFLPSPDDRIPSRMDGLKEIPGLVKQGLLEDAWMILDQHHQTLKDLDFIYAFKALILQKNGRTDAAEKILLAGLESGRGKFLLYERLGFLCFETGRLAEAVRCWIKSIVAMRMLNQVTMWEPFLYLAAVAKALAGETHAKILSDYATKLSPHGELSLDDNALKRLNEQAQGLSAPSVLKALDVLCLHFLQPRGSISDPAFPGIPTAGHAHGPGRRKPFLSIRRLWDKRGKDPWITRLTVIVLCLALILFFLQFLKSPEKTPETGASIAPPEIRQNSRETEDLKKPLPAPQTPIAQPMAEKKPVVEVEAEKPDKAVNPAEDPIPHKTKYSFLKSKIKTVHPDVKTKD